MSSSPETPSESQSEKFVQQHLVEAYQKELKKTRKEKPLANPKAASIDELSQSLADKITHQIAAAKTSLEQAVDSLEASLKNQFEQWCEIKAIVDQERQVLREVYQIDVPNDSLSAIVRLRQERRAQAEQSLMQTKLEFEKTMERQHTEMQLKEEAFIEKCLTQEEDFLEKCKTWEDEMMTRQEAFYAIEEELKRKKQQQETLWISRSDELDTAYDARSQQLESDHQETIRRLEQERQQFQVQMEQEWALRQQRWEQEIRTHQDALNRLQDQLREKGDEISRVNTKVLDLVSRKDISERVMTTMPAASQSQASGGGRIVRPIKMGARRPGS